MFRVQRGPVVDTIAAVRVRELLVRAEEPLLNWLCRNERLTVTMARDASGLHEVPQLLVWLAESENTQTVFRYIRAFMVDDTMRVEPATDVRGGECSEVCETLVRAIRQVILWIEDERNTPQLLSKLREVGETVEMSVIAQRMEHDADSSYQLAQRVFQSIRLGILGGRPSSGLSGLAGLAARSSLM